MPYLSGINRLQVNGFIVVTVEGFHLERLPAAKQHWVDNSKLLGRSSLAWGNMVSTINGRYALEGEQWLGEVAAGHDIL